MHIMSLDYSKGLRFDFTVRYVDDLLTLNNALIVKEILNIYPHKLALNRTSESNVHVSYLDINISIFIIFFNQWTITYIVHYSRYKKENQIEKGMKIEQRKESQNTHIKQGRTCDLTALTLNYLAASMA